MAPARATWSRAAGRPCCSTAGRACSPSCAGFVDYVDVDAVVISHLHADHMLDLVPFASGAALRAAPAAGPGRRAPGTDQPARPRLIAPPGALDAFAGDVRGDRDDAPTTSRSPST